MPGLGPDGGTGPLGSIAVSALRLISYVFSTLNPETSSSTPDSGQAREPDPPMKERTMARTIRKHMHR